MQISGGRYHDNPINESCLNNQSLRGKMMLLCQDAHSVSRNSRRTLFEGIIAGHVEESFAETRKLVAPVKWP